jgi:hypothetical protein
VKSYKKKQKTYIATTEKNETCENSLRFDDKKQLINLTHLYNKRKI